MPLLTWGGNGARSFVYWSTLSVLFLDYYGTYRASTIVRGLDDYGIDLTMDFINTSDN
jgi:hypothetical protein